jgi:hypothetical protein
MLSQEEKKPKTLEIDHDVEDEIAALTNEIDAD